jgi:hypothetical protein
MIGRLRVFLPDLLDNYVTSHRNGQAFLKLVRGLHVLS